MRKRVLILSGPTHEYIDPVRFIGNASSGKMGKALAEEAARRGYEIEFVTGPVDAQNIPSSGNIHQVTSAAEMLSEARKLFQDSGIIIFAAAVADYAPTEKRGEKMAKSSSELVLRLCPTPDIAQTLCREKRPDQMAVGFALQTADGETHARRKRSAKHLDAIVLNTPATLGAENGTFRFLPPRAEIFEEWGCIDKADCARRIFVSIERITLLDRLLHINSVGTDPDIDKAWCKEEARRDRQIDEGSAILVSGEDVV